MRSSRVLGILAGTTALALATLVVASPASAAKLPDGQKATIVEQTSDSGTGQFYDVNTDTGASSPFGTAAGRSIEGIEVGDDGLGVAIGLADFGDIGTHPAMFTANANTGVLSAPQLILLNGEDTLDACEGIDLVNSTYIISCVLSGDGATSYVGQLDPATGTFTPFLTLSGESYLQFQALANSTKTATLWGFALVGGVSTAYQLDLENDTATPFGEFVEPVVGADFDRDGKLFVSTYTQATDPEIDLPAIALADPATGVVTDVHLYVDSSNNTALIDVHTLTIWGAPGLAATGTTGTDILPIGLGSALLLLAGAAFIATARMNRRVAA